MEINSHQKRKLVITGSFFHLYMPFGKLHETVQNCTLIDLETDIIMMKKNIPGGTKSVIGREQ